MNSMNIEAIRSLSEIMNAAGLTALEVRQGDMRVSMEKSAGKAVAAAPLPSTQQAEPQPVGDNAPDLSGSSEIKSPLVGVFFAAPSPGAEPFVHIGSKVSAGDVLCIIEAMKLMNEITADRDGEVADICIKDGDIAEYGQALFKIR